MSHFTRCLVVGAVVLGLAAAVAPARVATPALESLFPHQAEIFVDEDRLASLPLPPEVLAQCRPDLSDLRILDPEGNEVPYLIDSGLGLQTRLARVEQIEPRVLGVERHETRRDEGPPLFRETYRLEVPNHAPETGRWDLVVVTRRAELVSRVDVTARTADGTSSPLIEQGSIYRLRGPARERTRVALPALPPAAVELVLTLEGEDETYLEPVMLLESSRLLDPRRRAEIELEEVSRRVERGRTIVELRRPRGLVPDHLRVETSTGAFHRDVEVWDEGPGGNRDALGKATLFRVRRVTSAEAIEVPMGAARGDRLRIVVDDADSPPLEDLRFVAVLRGPVILVALHPAGSSPAGRLLFGGGRAFRPRYDLARLLPASLPVTGRAAEVAGRLYDPEALATADLGPVTTNPDYDPAPALAFALRPGAEIVPKAYSHRREIRAGESVEGLYRLPLGLDDLAHARADLADLRIVDHDNRQWAYLVEPRATALRQALEPVAPESEEGRTSYRFQLPSSPATVSRIVLETSIPYFDRPFELLGIDADGDDRTLARGRIAREIGDPRPVVIGSFGAVRLTTLELVIENGNDAALDFDSAHALFPTAELFFAAPSGDYALLMGYPDDLAPRYELERVRSVVLAVDSATVETGELTDNPSFSRGARLATEAGVQRLFLWVALIGAVVGLAALTLKLARSSER